ncbi:hypothetical protein [Bifidobacterium animalis]|uniref:hypothetical protein n=1 Tax=Bifidobacterium animalis TaxID=28025 RepID=UPI0010204079|nr:hypothetical protein [Bifidobacterium animalis]
MDAWGIANLFIGGVGALGGVAGVVALLQAAKANKLSEEANSAAQEANRVAIDANGVAVESNDLASKANEISQDANAISQRALRIAADQTVYEWDAEFDAEAGTVRILNDCGADAFDVSVTVRAQDQTLAQGHEEHVPGFGELLLDGDLVGKKLVENNARWNGMRSAGYIVPRMGLPVRVHIEWESSMGSRRGAVVEKTFGQTKRQQRNI